VSTISLKRLSKRGRPLLALALSLAVIASAAGLVISLRGGGRAQAASAPGSARTRADLSQMQSVLYSGSVSKQAALLPPQIRLAPGSGPVVPPGKTITILPGTLRPDGRFGTVRARRSSARITTTPTSPRSSWAAATVPSTSGTSSPGG
jgi:hypothetical protein